MYQEMGNVIEVFNFSVCYSSLADSTDGHKYNILRNKSDTILIRN